MRVIKKLAMENQLPQLPPDAKCTRCKQRAIISLPAHNARFCRPCFRHYFQNAVRRALQKIGPPKNTPLLAAVSGGKDSLTLWSVLQDLGYRARGLHLNLGLDEYSEASRQAVQDFASSRNLDWSEYSLQQELGFTLPTLYDLLPEKICSLCGRLKRQFLNRLTAREGFTCLATGHNLDDEAGRLLGNLVGDRQEFVRRQYPYLPSPHSRIPAKIKPLYRLEIKEIIAYCHTENIQPVNIGCPLSRGATSHYFQQALEFLENKMPGSKRGFLYAYLRKPKDLHWHSQFNACHSCQEPALGEICPICSLQERLQQLQIKNRTRTTRSRGRRRRTGRKKR